MPLWIFCKFLFRSFVAKLAIVDCIVVLSMKVLFSVFLSGNTVRFKACNILFFKFFNILRFTFFLSTFGEDDAESLVVEGIKKLVLVLILVLVLVLVLALALVLILVLVLVFVLILVVTEVLEVVDVCIVLILLEVVNVEELGVVEKPSSEMLVIPEALEVVLIVVLVVEGGTVVLEV